MTETRTPMAASGRRKLAPVEDVVGDHSQDATCLIGFGYVHVTTGRLARRGRVVEDGTGIVVAGPVPV